MKQQTLRPGDLAVATEPTCLDTILGSCISVCLYDKRLRIGGMNHFMLPEPECNTSSYGANSNKYGTNAIRNLLRGMKRAGSSPDDLEAKVLGGANVGDSPEGSLQADVGRLNIKVALAVLRQFGVRIAAQDTGGMYGRKVEFNTETGAIRFHKIRSNISDGHERRHESKSSSGGAAERIRVLIVDDSKPIRLLLRKMLEMSKTIEVVGEAVDPIEAMEVRKRTKVDVMTLDLVMPRMDGNTYIKQFMRTDPIPTIVITNSNVDESARVIDALESGAFDYIGKPTFEGHDAYAAELAARIEAAYASREHVRPVGTVGLVGSGKVLISSGADWLENSLILIGASTGGTEAVREVLTRLPANVPPILIVQHIPPIFSKAFAQKLASICPFPVEEATHGMEVKAGHAYVAPGGKQMKIHDPGGTLRIAITDDPPVNKFRPSVDYLYKSACELRDKSRLKRTLAILMTGMGNDGAQGMKMLRDLGVHTVAQDEASCVVFGMPKEAIKLGGVDHVLSLGAIPGKISEFFNRTGSSQARKAG
jgi:two-component system chemotaxis response regulator CheB